ncbi:MAG: GNAT family N-acetyltransferase, partial [Bacteroidia bacterium]
ALYDKFVEEHGTIFNSSAWKRQVHKDSMSYYGIYEDDQQLIGAFHLYTERIAGMNFVKNPPYIPHIGLVYKNRSANAANALSFDKKIIELIASFTDGLSYSVISIALPDAIKDLQPFIWKKYKVVPNYTYLLSLDQEIAELEKRLSPEHRNSLKKAAKEQVSVEQTKNYEQVKALIMNTFSRKSKPVNEAMINAILFQLANEQNSFAFVASQDSKPIAAAFCLFDKQACYYLLGGYDSQLKHSGAGILCIWNSILHAKEKGLKQFDFEGSMIREVERYFRAFGPELVSYYTVNKAKLPLEMALKFIKREQF